MHARSSNRAEREPYFVSSEFEPFFSDLQSRPKRAENWIAASFIRRKMNSGAAQPRKKTYPRFQNLPHTNPTSPRRNDGQSRDRLEIGGERLDERSRHKGVTAQGPSGANRPVINVHTVPPSEDQGTSHTGPVDQNPSYGARQALFLSSERTAPGAGALRTPLQSAGAPARGGGRVASPRLKDLSTLSSSGMEEEARKARDGLWVAESTSSE